MQQKLAKRVRDLCRARLQGSAGLNAQFSTLFGGSGVAELPRIDWTPEARQFFQAQISFEDLVDSDNPATPCVFLYTVGSENQNRSKFQIFAGEIEVRIDIEIEVKGTAAPETFEDYADLVEESIIRCFNSPWDETAGGTNVTYNGRFKAERSAVKQDDADAWRQTISANFIFGVTL
jgi:hypothetical protein